MASIDAPPVPAISPIRPRTQLLPLTSKTPSFVITAGNKSYKHQYSNIYFVRLKLLRSAIEERATRRWRDVKGNPVLLPRVLDVVKGKLCYVIGTIYMDMPLKPNVLEDIGRDHSIAPPPPPAKIYSDNDSTMLEDESGRLKLVGERINKDRLVTGVIVAVLGIETNSGEFEVVDVCDAGLPDQPSASEAETEAEAEEAMDIDQDEPSSSSSGSQDGWIALVSGLDVGALSPADAQLQLLVEYLTGESGDVGHEIAGSRVSRLVIAGNSFSKTVSLDPNSTEETGEAGDGKAKSRRYGYDSTSFSPHPTLNLGAHLLDIGRTMPVHILPGPSDPTGINIPQQPLPRAMFGSVASYESFVCETNPTWLRFSSGSGSDMDSGVDSGAATSSRSSKPWTRTILVNSGQPLDDMYKYLPTPPSTRLSLAASTLSWRHQAPTAPDTLWCHPYFSTDPFIIHELPDLYVIGNQPNYKSKLVKSHKDGKGGRGAGRCRIVLLPSFATTGIVVLVNMRSLEVRRVYFGVEGMGMGEGEGIPS